jgi:hypothetical protein
MKRVYDPHLNMWRVIDCDGETEALLPVDENEVLPITDAMAWDGVKEKVA